MIRHDLPHPNVHCAAQAWSNDQVLHVAAVYNNPCRWRSRRELFHSFRQHMRCSPNVQLYVGEIAYGDRPFDVTDPHHLFDFQFRCRDELWHKENLLNQVIGRFDPGWRYGAWVDADLIFTRHDWALETIHQLQTWDWVQMFSTYTDLTHDHRPIHTLPGFAYAVERGLDVKGQPIGEYGRPGSPGLCWGFRRESLDQVGGLLDTCILGSGDFHMAIGLAQLPVSHPDTTECGEPYQNHIRAWQQRALRANRNIGYVDCHVIHHFHGPKHKRGYEWRWRILQEHDYDPMRDIYRDWQGLWQLTPRKPGFRDDIRAYFRSRNEDSIGCQEG